MRNRWHTTDREAGLLTHKFGVDLYVQDSNPDTFPGKGKGHRAPHPGNATGYNCSFPCQSPRTASGLWLSCVTLIAHILFPA